MTSNNWVAGGELGNNEKNAQDFKQIILDILQDNENVTKQVSWHMTLWYVSNSKVLFGRKQRGASHSIIIMSTAGLCSVWSHPPDGLQIGGSKFVQSMLLLLSVCWVLQASFTCTISHQYCTPFRKGEDKADDVEDPDGEVLTHDVLAWCNIAIAFTNLAWCCAERAEKDKQFNLLTEAAGELMSLGYEDIYQDSKDKIAANLHK